jgi:hypothetical protein
MGRTLQLSGRRGTTLAGHRVEVHVRLDGSALAFDGDRIIALAAAPASATQLRAGRYRRVEPSLTPAPATLPWTPPGDHPWNRLGTFRSRSTD